MWSKFLENDIDIAGAILIDLGNKKVEIIDIDEAQNLSNKFCDTTMVLAESELINRNVIYGDFCIDENANYVNDFSRVSPENIGIFSNISSKEKIILNYMQKGDDDLEYPFKTTLISGKCLIVGVDLKEDGTIDNFVPLTFSSMVGIVKGCLALDSEELEKKQNFLKSSIEEYLSQFD